VRCQGVVRQVQSGNLSFVPDAVGAHRSRQVQVDVVAVNWQSRDVLLGECKWGTDKLDRQDVRDRIERTGPRPRKDLTDEGSEWAVHCAMFDRAGFTGPAVAELDAQGGLHTDLEKLDGVLSG
jgi:hypothetical protein